MKKIYCAATFLFLIIAGANVFAKEEYKINDIFVDSLFDNSIEIFSETIFATNEPIFLKSDKSYVVAGIMGVFCGWTGLHRFYLNQTKAGLVHLSAGVCLPVLSIGVMFAIFGYGVATQDPFNQEEGAFDKASELWSYSGCIVGPAVLFSFLLGFVDGVIYLVAGEKKFQSKYRNNKKLIQWM